MSQMSSSASLSYSTSKSPRRGMQPLMEILKPGSSGLGLSAAPPLFLSDLGRPRFPVRGGSTDAEGVMEGGGAASPSSPSALAGEAWAVTAPSLSSGSGADSSARAEGKGEAGEGGASGEVATAKAGGRDGAEAEANWGSGAVADRR